MSQRVPGFGPGAPLLAIVLFLALAVRIPYFFASDFPLNDGGLFFVMSREVADAGFSLPAVTSYNLDDIPFAYPPLAFYTAAAISRILDVPLLTLVRYLPLLANLLAIVVFWLLARALLRAATAAFFAAAAFVVMPRSYEWLVMGGGLTRSFGLLFAVASLYLAIATYRRPVPWRIVATGLLLALALLSHLEMGLFAAYSVGLYFLVRGRDRPGLVVSALLAALVALFTAPWWLAVASRHGLSPYYAASATAGWSTFGDSLVALLDYVYPGQPALAVLGALGTLGLLACALRGQLYLPLWLALVFVLTPRSAPTGATLALALLVGAGAADVVLRGLRHAPRAVAPLWCALAARPLPRSQQPVGRALGTMLAGTAALGLAIVPSGLLPGASLEPLESLHPAERAAMSWVATHTPATGQFLVLSPKASWEADYILEWFPALASRKSVFTPQGAEWLPHYLHARRSCLYNLLRAQALGSLDDLETWLSTFTIPYSHVYISKMASGPIDLEPLRHDFSQSPHYVMVMDTDGATVLVRADPLIDLEASPRDPPIARDCQTLFEQPPSIQATFYGLHGELAPWVWVQEHDAETQRERLSWRTLLPMPSEWFGATLELARQRDLARALSAVYRPASAKEDEPLP